MFTLLRLLPWRPQVDFLSGSAATDLRRISIYLHLLQPTSVYSVFTSPEIKAVCGNTLIFVKGGCMIVLNDGRLLICSGKSTLSSRLSANHSRQRTLSVFFPSCSCPGSRSEMSLLFVKSAMTWKLPLTKRIEDIGFLRRKLIWR